MEKVRVNNTIWKSLLLLFLWIGYQYSIHTLSHAHVVDGIVYVHSHLSSDNGKAEVHHQHTSSQLYLITQITNPTYELKNGLGLSEAFQELLYDAPLLWTEVFVALIHHSVHQLRGPPVV